MSLVKIYNLYPLIAGKISSWHEKIDYIKDLGFDTIYINPIFEMGYNKNLYAPKNFLKFSQDFLSSFDGDEEFKSFVDKCHEKGLKVIYELIFTHTSIDSDLLTEHPEWYINNNGALKKYSIKTENKWIEWGDLLELNNHSDKDSVKTNLWSYWHDITRNFINLGVDYIKIHSAFYLPQEPLKSLISSIKLEYPHMKFIGDNLGASFSDMLDLSRIGVDYLFTSFKWWDFKSPWFFEQHYKLKDNVNLISFPESYDTERIAKIYDGNINAQKMFYGVSALINKGVLIPIGFETGSQKKLNDMSLYDFDFEEEEFNISDYIKKINNIKCYYKLFSEENDIYYLSQSNDKIFAFKKMNKERNEFAIVIANLNFYNSEKVLLNDIFYVLESSDIKDISPENQEIIDEKIYEKLLLPGEIRILYSKK